ncbi:MAG: 50S ribosomal protein L30 [Candidatus Midichloria mitochondrii]|uniref:50S ribosomal protein L30 n=1 Tax=Midichloria mitochondrii (strain IricVA) TaxID=696127 RepID=F7XUL8_MIDMI|nr:50S ribosomal protein L30 [Candidatus Midichloria mitochondrii]AEI88367.1 ribosomal protein L30 [Candidatus Midichloria mitochondrii IricVA]
MAEKKVIKAEGAKTVEKKVDKPTEKAPTKTSPGKMTVPEGAAPKVAELKTEVKKKVAPKAERVVEKKAPSKSEGKVKIQQIAGSAGRDKSQIATLKGLNLNKTGKVAELEDTSAVRGMIEKVKHLLRFK